MSPLRIGPEEMLCPGVFSGGRPCGCVFPEEGPLPLGWARAQALSRSPVRYDPVPCCRMLHLRVRACREEMVGAVVEGHGRAADLALITGCDAALLERACSANAATTSSSNGGTSADTGSSNSSSGASDRAQGCLEACADVARGLGSPAILVVEVGCTVGSTSGTPGGAHGGGGSLITRGGAPGAPVSAAALTAAAFVAAAAVRETWTAHPGLPVVGVLATEVSGPFPCTL